VFTLTRRSGLMGLAAYAIAEMAGGRVARATAQCTTGNCSGNQVCCEGFTCTATGEGDSKRCIPDNPECPTCDICEVCPPPDPGPWYCVEDAECGGGDLFCHEGTCCTVVTVNVGDQVTNVTVPVTIITNCGGGRKRHRHHHHHHTH
jgi:hypothetical protein